jgi:serine/threonine protein kinase
MATVWLAHDALENRPVAIQVLNRELAGVVGVGRFLREIQVTAALDHPSVVPVLDTGTWDAEGVEQPWSAMPLMEGGSLRARLTRDRQLVIDDAVSIAQDLGEALQTAHAKGAVHRDITHGMRSVNDPGGSRTRDLRIKSPLLYQLSYRVGGHNRGRTENSDPAPRRVHGL